MKKATLVRTRVLGAVVIMLPLAAFPQVVHAAAVSGQGTWETTLKGRDLDGNLATFEAYYDTALDITWLADANYGYGSSYDSATGQTDGKMIWVDANTWATGLNFNGITGWRLPMMTDTGSLGCDFAYTGTDCGYNVDPTTSEMAHMYYITLGDKAQYDTAGNPQAGWGLTNTGPFSNIRSDAYYWSAVDYAPYAGYKWVFQFVSGLQHYDTQAGGLGPLGLYAWAVHAGDVGGSAVPVPAAVWLFCGGLVSLVGIAKREHRHSTVQRQGHICRLS